MDIVQEEVQQHCTAEDNWMVIDGVVLDVSKLRVEVLVLVIFLDVWISPCAVY